MFRYRVLIFSILFLLIYCSHLPNKKETNAHFLKSQEAKLYQHLEDAIKATNAKHLKECNCMKAFYRNLFIAPDESARFVFDRKVGEHALLLAKERERVSVLAIGSGTLLNELTAFANILARGKSLDIYLTDYAYLFYGDKDFEAKALRLGNNPNLIPDDWRDFYFWGWAKNNEKPYLPFFALHHTAIEEFKTIIKRLDAIYGTNSKINIIKPPQKDAIKLPPLDLIISIDAFVDVPNLMWNLFYQFNLGKPQVRFIALNKNKPLGGTYESSDLSIREELSLNPVTVDIYDISSEAKIRGAFKMLERITFEPSLEQLKHAPDFKLEPGRDSTQNPLDLGQ